MSILNNPSIKERLEVLEAGARFFRANGDAFNIPLEEQRADNGHAQVNLSAVRRAEQAGLNYTEKPAESTGTARIRESNGELEKWEKQVAEGKGKLKKLQADQKEQYAQFGHYEHSRKLLKVYALKLNPDAELLFGNTKVLKRKQESDPEALQRIEAEIADAFELRKKTLRAPKSVDEAKACWTAQVRKYANTGEPDWGGLYGANGKEARLNNFFVDGIARADGVSLLMWCSEEVLIEKGHRAIEEYAALEGGDGLSTEARAAKVADLDSVIFEKESEWTELWFSLAKTGVYVPHRKILTNDARPLAGLSAAMKRIEFKPHL